MRFNLDDVLHLISFLFTLIIILIAIVNGLSSIEIVIDILYFTTLNLTFLRYLFRNKK